MWQHGVAFGQCILCGWDEAKLSASPEALEVNSDLMKLPGALQFKTKCNEQSSQDAVAL